MFDNKEQEPFDGIQDQAALFEAFFIDACKHMDESSLNDFLESDTVKALTEANAVRKSTIVRLSKEDDYARRLTVAAVQKAKEQNSPDWRKLKKATAMRKMALAAIVKRYGNFVKRDVIRAQKALLKADPMHYVRIPRNNASSAKKK